MVHSSHSIWTGRVRMLANRIALVTGATGGIGTAICRYFAQQGAKVIATNHSDKKGLPWLTQQKEDGYNFHAYATDVSDYDSCVELGQRVPKEVGPVDIIINNAGITNDSQFYKMSKTQWDLVMRTNLDSLFNITKQFIDGMIERQFGRIINISSVNAHQGQFGQTNYAATKAGIHGFTKSLAREVARKGITVNTVSPGYVATSMVMDIAEDIREKIIAQIPVKRLGEPFEIARLIGFLAAPESSYITGADFSINGGLHMY